MGISTKTGATTYLRSSRIYKVPVTRKAAERMAQAQPRVRLAKQSAVAVLGIIAGVACGSSKATDPGTSSGGNTGTAGITGQVSGGAAGSSGNGAGSVGTAAGSTSGASGSAASTAGAPGTTGSTGASAAGQAGAAPVGGAVQGKWPDLADSTAPAHAPGEATNTGAASLGGTMTFQNIGALGWWGRRIEATEGDPRCDVEAKWLEYSWGGKEFCCRTKHQVTTDKISPFNEELTMVLDGPLRIKQLAVYQPLSDSTGAWAIRSFWDRRSPDTSYNLHWSGPNDSAKFTGDLGNSCSFFAMQEKKFACGAGSDPYCPGSALDYHGWAGSKLIVLLASMPYAQDPALKPLSCSKDKDHEDQEDSPWVGVAPSELDRDGWSGYHPCHCFANTDAAVGDGCGQINVFEVVAESSGAQWGNRDIISTGIRSYQVGSLGGAVCGVGGCTMDHFPQSADLLDANALKAMSSGAVLDALKKQTAAGPVWRRPLDDRYFAILLDEPSRTVQVMILHPGNLPATVKELLPALPNQVPRSIIDALVALRLPQ